MLNKQTSKLTALAFAASLVLTACGGGGGGSSNATPPASGASTPAAPASGASSTPASSGVAPQTSVAAPTYAAGTFQAAAFQVVNNYRLAMGVGEVAQDPVLDMSAQHHSDYTFTNLASNTITTLDHDEVQGNADFYATTPLLRAQLAGAPTTEWIGENMAAGTMQSATTAAANCIGQALASVYHLEGLTATQQTIGIGYTAGTAAYPLYTCVTDFGTSTGVVGAPGANENSYAGGQQLPVGTVLSSPFSNETGVALAMAAESPNPAPDVAAPGRPILVRVNAEDADLLTVTQFTLTNASGTAVAARILVPAAEQAGSTATTVADPNAILANGTAVLLPLAPLTANTTYTVTFSGARDGSPLSKTWTFTTAAS